MPNQQTNPPLKHQRRTQRHPNAAQTIRHAETPRQIAQSLSAANHVTENVVKTILPARKAHANRNADHRWKIHAVNPAVMVIAAQ